MEPIVNNIGAIKREVEKGEISIGGRVKTYHIHASSLPNKTSKVQMQPYEVKGTTGRGKFKQPFFEKGLVCPKCFRVVSN